MILGGACALVLGLSAAGLDGKTVFLSPGHGFYYHATYGWLTQRPAIELICEDVETADTCFAFLTEYLRRAGADVWPCRAECPSPVEIIIDDTDPRYEEEGAWLPIAPDGYNGGARYASVAPGSSAVARFRPSFPASGRYPLYLWYPAGTDRTAAALVRVRHAAGVETVRINQQRHGSTWRFAGWYFFFAGEGQTIEISADGADTTKIVVADAVRIGGGMGSVEPNDGVGGISGQLRYHECSVYWARYQGAPDAVYNPLSDGDGSDDVTCRPRYSEWEREGGEDALYLSYHTNAGGGTGTETYSMTGGAPPGSRLLRDLLQEEIVRDLREAWDPAWVDRGTKEANFGELRLLSTMPGALIESAFHDNPADLAAERSPLWRRIVTRAIYHAVVRYWHGDAAVMLPEPPEGLAARAIDAGSVRLSWRAGPAGAGACGAGAAEYYRVAVSRDGLAFALDGETAATSATLENLPAGVPLFFRVTAVNGGGESLPSATAGVVLPGDPERARLLLVHAFPGDEGVVRSVTWLTDRLGDVLRLEPGRTPGGRDGALEHAAALHAARPDAALDFAEKEALGDFALDAYDAIALDFGEQADNVLPEAAAELLVRFLDGGGRAVVTGGAAASWIAARGGAQARALLARMGVEFGANLTAPATIASYGAFAGLGMFSLGETTDWRRSGATVLTQIRPVAGVSAAVMNAAAGIVGVHRPGKGVWCGFALEAVPLGAMRAAFCARALEAALGAPALDTPEIELREGRALMLLANGEARAALGTTAQGEARCAWSVEGGPAGGATIESTAWALAREGFGFGDYDDVSVIPIAARACPSVLMRHAFSVDDPAALASLLLDVRYDDGFSAYVNGREVARRNLAADAGLGAWALSSIEPTREEIEIGAAAAPALLPGENVLALSFHNASATSSDFTASAALRACAPGGGCVFPIPPGAAWHYMTCGQTAGEAWNAASLDALGLTARLRFTEAGTYVVAVRIEGAEGASLPATFAFDIFPEDAQPFLRGDGNSDGAVDLADAVAVLAYLFARGEAPCFTSMDANGSRVVDLSDAVYLLRYLFAHTAPPPAPGPVECGLGTAAGYLGCDLPAPRCR